MYRYNIKDGLFKISTSKQAVEAEVFDADKHESLAEALGFDLYQDSFVLDHAVEAVSQDYSIKVYGKSAGKDKQAHFLADNSDYVVEIIAYDDSSLILIDDLFSLYKLLGELLPTQKLIRQHDQDMKNSL